MVFSILSLLLSATASAAKTSRAYGPGSAALCLDPAEIAAMA